MDNQIRQSLRSDIALQIRGTPDENLRGMDYMLFFDNCREDIILLIAQQLKERNTFRMYIALQCTLITYNLQTGEVKEEAVGCFQSQIVTFTQQSDVDELYDGMVAYINRNIDAYITRGSGWRFSKILCIDLNITTFNPSATRGRGNDGRDLPKVLQKKNALINVTHGLGPNDCFVGAVISSTISKIWPDMPKKARHPECLKTWKDLWEQYHLTYPSSMYTEPTFNYTEMPMDLNRLYLFERENPLYRISVLSYDEKQKCVFTLSPPSVPQDNPNILDTIKIIPIFYYNEHFFGINQLNRLINERSKRHRLFCPICLAGYKTDKLLQEHIINFCNRQTPKQTVYVPNMLENGTSR